MFSPATDLERIEQLLKQVAEQAATFLQAVDTRPVAIPPAVSEPMPLPEEGIGTSAALDLLWAKYGAGFIASSGPRYWGFVTGGATPAGIIGDWLTTTFDQNATGASDSAAGYLERETVGFLAQLFGLSAAHTATFVSGATMANVVGLALGRQWAAGPELGQLGLYGRPPIPILSGAPHSSIYKALSLLGMGKGNVQLIPCLPGREAVDIALLEQALADLGGRPAIVVANAGTVNSVDFDDLAAIAQLKEKYNFWLHTDAAFGGFAACSPTYRHLTVGLDKADSITIDAHKWLNVPYDSAMQFTRHRHLQVAVFQNSAAYLGQPGDNPDFVHLTPENSRRLRALPAWFTLLAYGQAGCREIVERCCQLAGRLAEKIATSPHFQLLAPVRLNVVCFAPAGQPTFADIQGDLAALRDDGRLFLTPTLYNGQPAIRAAFSNWRTRPEDLDLAWEAMQTIWN